MLSSLPPLMLSGVTFMAILWLTLAPQPLGEEPPPMFPGADKLAHAIMFGGFAAMMLLDYQRKHNWRMISYRRALTCSALSSLLGIGIEFAQANMGLGRSLETADMIADTIGAFLAAIFWISFQKCWVPEIH